MSGNPPAATSVLKRAIDLTVALAGMTVLALPMALIAVLIRLASPGPVLFRQKRPGLNETPFVLLKFRTMTDARDAAGNLLSDRERLTRPGRFLRRTSLDELPELVNVLKGEMSLAGPRPLLMRYLPFYTARERLRHAVRPGITGWAQVNGRNALPWDARLGLDVWYVENWSLALDLRILLLTLWKVAKGDGVSVDTAASETSLDAERRGSALKRLSA